MSELKNRENTGIGLRCRLLATASLFTLMAPIYAAHASDADRSNVWIEIGGQLERQSQDARFAPPFLVNNTPPSFENPTPLEAQQSPRFSYGAEGKVIVRPDDSGWNVSVGVRYGRSNGGKKVHQSGPSVHEVISKYSEPYSSNTAQPLLFANTVVSHRESHAILDFAAGKDVGLGLFGSHAQSTINFGVRLAQFSSRSSVNISSDPDLIYKPVTFGPFQLHHKYHHTYVATATTARSFHGVGPSVSWSGSFPVAGHPDHAELLLDIGLNATVLFGRQKATVHQATHGEYNSTKYVIGATIPHNITYAHGGDHVRARSVTVPDIGGFAGLSYRYSNAKVSFGYRGEVFFHAMDDGFATAHSADRSFYGPFATIGISLGG